MGVVNIVKKKMNSATFSAMLALFMKRACSVECQRIARLVGNVDDNPEQFAVQTEEEFNKLLKIQGEEDLDTIIVEKLRAKGKESDASERGSRDGRHQHRAAVHFLRKLRQEWRWGSGLGRVPYHGAHQQASSESFHWRRRSRASYCQANGGSLNVR
jgi:hypothetical protein